MPLYYEVIRATTLLGEQLSGGEVVSDESWPSDLARKLTEQRVVALLSVPMTESEARRHAVANRVRFVGGERGPVTEQGSERGSAEDSPDALDELAQELAGKTAEEWAAYSEISRRRWRAKAKEQGD